jgi:hypothetical protein
MSMSVTCPLPLYFSDGGGGPHPCTVTTHSTAAQPRSIELPSGSKLYIMQYVCLCTHVPRCNVRIRSELQSSCRLANRLVHRLVRTTAPMPDDKRFQFTERLLCKHMRLDRLRTLSSDPGSISSHKTAPIDCTRYQVFQGSSR